MDLLERINHWENSAPDQPVHLSAGKRLTYGELRDRSNALARRILRTPSDDRRPVAVIGHKEPDMLIGFLGAIKAGTSLRPA